MPMSLKNGVGVVQNIGKIFYKSSTGVVSEISRVYWKNSGGIVNEIFSGSPDSSSLYAVVNGSILVKMDNSLEIINQINLPVSPTGMCIDNDENIYLVTYRLVGSNQFISTIYKYSSSLILLASKEFSMVWSGGTPAGTYIPAVQVVYNHTTNCVFVRGYRGREEESDLSRSAKISLDLQTVIQGSQRTNLQNNFYSSPYGLYQDYRYEGRDSIYALNLNMSTNPAEVLGSYRWISGGDNNLGYLNVTYATPYPTVADGMENYYAPQGIIASIRAPKDYRGCSALCKFYKSNNRDAIMKYNMPTVGSGYCMTDRYTFSTVGIQPNDPFNGDFMNGAMDKYDMINIKSYAGNAITKYDKNFQPICSRTFNSVQFMECL